jgi:hypothetical protein
MRPIHDDCGSTSRVSAGSNIAPHGQRLYREPGIAISMEGRTLVAVDDTEPAVFLIDTERERLRDEVRLKDVPKGSPATRRTGVCSLSQVSTATQ